MLALWHVIVINLIVLGVMGYFFIFKTLRANESGKWLNVALAVVAIGLTFYFTVDLYQPTNVSVEEPTSLFPASCDGLEETYIQTCKKTDNSHCYAYVTNESIGVERLSNEVIFITAFDYNHGEFIQYSYYNNEVHPNEGSQKFFMTKIRDRVVRYFLEIQEGTHEYQVVEQYLTCFEDVAREYNETLVEEVIADAEDLAEQRQRVDERKQALGDDFNALDEDLLTN